MWRRPQAPTRPNAPSALLRALSLPNAAAAATLTDFGTALDAVGQPTARDLTPTDRRRLLRPPSFKATAAIAVIAAAATHHDRRPPAHCGHDRRCIVKVARWDCRHWRDRHHCRIAYRADHPNTTHTLLGGNAATISTTHALETVPGETETAFDQCVAQIESTGGLYVDNGAGDLGIYQFTTQTYDYALELMTQRGYAVAGWDPDPLTAPAYQQTAVFNFYSAIDPGAWPYSVPACGGA